MKNYILTGTLCMFLLGACGEHAHEHGEEGHSHEEEMHAGEKAGRRRQVWKPKPFVREVFAM